MALFLPDANILINALHSESVHHQHCRTWITDAVNNGDTIALCELVEAALLRICTNPKTRIVPVMTTLQFWQHDLWNYSQTIRISASQFHTNVFLNYLINLNLIGNDVNDAWLAALAVEHDATLVSLDQGFARFADLRWLNPRDDCGQ